MTGHVTANVHWSGVICKQPGSNIGWPTIGRTSYGERACLSHDGTIVTVYYAWDIVDNPRMGIHGGALLYRPEDF